MRKKCFGRRFVVTLILVMVGSFIGTNTILAATATGSGNANPLGVAGGYNMFVFGNVKQSNSDVMGSMAVGGNTNIAGYNVGGSLVVKGTLTAGDGNAPTSIIVGTQQGSTYPSYWSPTFKTSGFPVDFSAVKTEACAIAEKWMNYPGAKAVSFSAGALNFEGSDSALNVFTIAGDSFKQATSIHINCPQNSIVVINITGSTISLPSCGMDATVPISHILFNFADAATVNSSAISLEGSVLAPNATWNPVSGNGHIGGNFIVGSLVSDIGSIECHNNFFVGCLPPSSSSSSTSTTTSSTPVSSSPVSSTATSSTHTVSIPDESTPLTSAPSSTPVSSTPVSSTPVSSTPVSSTPASSTPVSSTPVSSTPVSSTPVSSTPVSSTPVSSTPVSSTPVSSTPVSSTPASSTPASSTPASSTPVSSTPTVSIPDESTPLTSAPTFSSTPVSAVSSKTTASKTVSSKTTGTVTINDDDVPLSGSPTTADNSLFLSLVVSLLSGIVLTGVEIIKTYVLVHPGH